MDFDSLKSTISNLTLYDVKAGVRKVQNAVMNYTEMEAKVREATNNEPWGASSSLMQEIANATFNYAQLNEIMPMIYKRFTEKAADEWRQIYKSLQLLEFLIKNGSERVIDDARSHMSLLKMLRQFHFIDLNGKDQGINVRNRAKELAELLSDVEKIRAERKKARATRNKYGGYEGGSGGIGGASSGGSRYGGFGSDQGGYGGYSGGVYGDGGGFGGQEIDVGPTQARRDQFQEYNEYDEGDVAPAGRRKQDTTASPRVRKETKPAAAPPPKAKQPEVDLFSFDDEPVASASNGSSAMAPAAADDDDFDDFQSAAPAATPAAAPTSFAMPAPSASIQPTSNAFGALSPPPSSSNTGSVTAFSPAATSTASVPTVQSMRSPTTPAGYQASQPNYFTSVPMGAQQVAAQQASARSTPASLASLGKPSSGIASGPAKGKSADPFASLLGGGAKSSQPVKSAAMGDMAKQKSSAGLWGTPVAATSPASTTSAPPSSQGQKLGGGLDDLLG